jgi:serine/threonine protein kinase
LKYPIAISAEAKHMIESLLVVQPEKRISIPNVLRHPWLKDVIDGIEGTEEDDIHDF